MDADTFIKLKQEAAQEELRIIEAEYARRHDAAQAMVSLTKTWLDELESAEARPKVDAMIEEIVKSPPNVWAPLRDIND